MTRSHVDGFIAQFIWASYVSEMERSWVRILINYEVALKLFLWVYTRDGLYCEWRFNAGWLPHLILIKVTRDNKFRCLFCLVISAGSSPWDRGLVIQTLRWGGGQSPKIFFGPSGLSWSKTKEETRAPPTPSLDPPLVISPIVGTGIRQTVKRNQDRAQSGPWLTSFWALAQCCQAWIHLFHSGMISQLLWSK